MPASTHDPTSLPPARRRWIKAALGAVAAAITAVLAVPLGGFFALPALRRRPIAWSEVGPVDQFPAGEITFAVLKPLTATVWPEASPRMGVFVSRKPDGSFEVFHDHCTHVGCPINWSRQANRFFSPCHGGVFDPDGRVLAGPPPRPLDRHEWKVENGVLYAGRIYQVNDRLEQVAWYHG